MEIKTRKTTSLPELAVPYTIRVTHFLLSLHIPLPSSLFHTCHSSRPSPYAPLPSHIPPRSLASLISLVNRPSFLSHSSLPFLPSQSTLLVNPFHYPLTLLNLSAIPFRKKRRRRGRKKFKCASGRSSRTCVPHTICQVCMWSCVKCACGHVSSVHVAEAAKPAYLTPQLATPFSYVKSRWS